MLGIIDHLRLAIGTLASNPLRSLLTLLGIIIVHTIFGHYSRRVMSDLLALFMGDSLTSHDTNRCST